MIDPTSFLLGMLAHDFLTRSMKKSQVTNIVLAMMFGLIMFDVLIRIGAFDAVSLWWQGLR